MFEKILNIFERKPNEIDSENIRDFNDILKTIKYYIKVLEFSKAETLIKEVRKKELEFYKNLLWETEINEKQKKDLEKYYKKRINNIDKLNDKYTKAKFKYDEILEKEKTKIRILKVEKKIDELIWKKNINLAEWLLNNFLESYKEDSEIVKFYNKQKKKIVAIRKKNKYIEEEKLTKNSQKEAMKLIWKLKKEDDLVEDIKKKNTFYWKILDRINIVRLISQKIKDKKLLDEVTMLLEEDKNITENNLKSKLWKIHRWLTREIINDELLWFRFFWKTLWADRITWDVFGFDNFKKKYIFYIWDATGHWIRSGFTITFLKEAYKKYVWKYEFKELVVKINNYLKEKLKSWNFVTWIFFEIDKKDYKEIKYIWAGHEPMLIYRQDLWIVENIRPWWLAAGIRYIKDSSSIKENKLILKDWDILFIYSDWVLESRNSEKEMFWIDRLSEKFKMIADTWKSLPEIYEYILKSLENFTWSSRFEDDMTIVFVKRDVARDIVNNKEDISHLITKAKIPESYAKKLIWKSREDIEKELEKIKNKEAINVMIRNLEQLYETWEIIKLKEEAIRYIKDWFIDKRINKLLKLAMKKEFSYKIAQKNKRLESKYKTLEFLLKKWDYETVFREASEVIAKDGNI
jgi:hypothetical protein